MSNGKLNYVVNVEEVKKNNPFKVFKFWASKPLEYALAYLDQYAEGKMSL